MNQPARIFAVLQPLERCLQWGNIVVLLGLVALLYAGVSLAVHIPLALRGPDISLAPEVLPYYAVLSVGRMAAAVWLAQPSDEGSCQLADSSSGIERQIEGQDIHAWLA